MNMEVALALLACSPPLTAVIMKVVPRRGGDFVSTREFDRFCNKVVGELQAVRMELETLRMFIKSRS